jgi:hypothetical protein
MLRFQVVAGGQARTPPDLQGAHLVGTDGVALRGDIRYDPGLITCEKRTAGPASLALLWPVEGVGRLLLETARLQERERPYHLHRELVRGRLMRLSQKREDWVLQNDDPVTPETAREIDGARDLFVESIKADDVETAAKRADEALRIAVDVGERLSITHARTLLARRREAGDFGRRVFGCGLDLRSTSDAYREHFVEAFDFACVPVHWRDIEAREQDVSWDRIDPWVDWLSKRRIPIQMGPLVSFDERNVPDWLYMWENDYETVKDLVYNHIRRVVSRYSSFVQSWEVISGIHCDNCFHFNFEQLMELTRLAGALCKQLAPRSTTIIRLRALWGEYYARNQRTIPPMLYADMAVQSGIIFDAFGLEFLFGLGKDGLHVRDMFQITSMIDRLAGLGKPFHITAAAVPSSSDGRIKDSTGAEYTVGSGGVWRRTWDEATQAAWLRSFYELALSKPCVESVSWSTLADHPDAILPASGLLRADNTPKPVYEALQAFRRQISRDHSRGKTAVARVPPPRRS